MDADERMNRIDERLEAIATHVELEFSLQDTRLRQHEAELKALTEVAQGLAETQRTMAEAFVRLARTARDHERRIGALESK